jgi:hypothetical protein
LFAEIYSPKKGKELEYIIYGYGNQKIAKENLK